MAISSYPPVPAAKRTVVTLTSGTSWTVPTGVTSVNVTLIGAGGGSGGGSGSSNYVAGQDGLPGQLITSNVATTPGASIAYAIGAGGTAGASFTAGGTGGSTTFTGATSATGGAGGFALDYGNTGRTGQAGARATNYASGGSGVNNGGVGGAGLIEIEYWV